MIDRSRKRRELCDTDMAGGTGMVLSDALNEPLSAAEKIGVLAGLLEPVDADGDTTAPSDRRVDDPLIDWILQTQAAETMDYLDDRLAAAPG